MRLRAARARAVRRCFRMVTTVMPTGMAGRKTSVPGAASGRAVQLARGISPLPRKDEVTGEGCLRHAAARAELPDSRIRLCVSEGSRREKTATCTAAAWIAHGRERDLKCAPENSVERSSPIPPPSFARPAYRGWRRARFGDSSDCPPRQADRRFRPDPLEARLFRHSGRLDDGFVSAATFPSLRIDTGA